MKVFRHTFTFFVEQLTTLWRSPSFNHKQTTVKKTKKDLDNTLQALTVVLVMLLLGVGLAFALYVKYS